MDAQDGLRIVVIGGGIAAVSCVNDLIDSSFVRKGDVQITFITASATVRQIAKIERLGRLLERLDVEDVAIEEFTNTVMNNNHGGQLDNAKNHFRVIRAIVTRIDTHTKRVIIGPEYQEIAYDKICICTGAVPRLLLSEHPLVIGLRDDSTLDRMMWLLRNTRRILLVGNGGIATALVQEYLTAKNSTSSTKESGFTLPQLIWAVRDNYVGSAFVDALASEFLLEQYPELKSAVSRAVAAATTKAESVLELSINNEGFVSCCDGEHLHGNLPVTEMMSKQSRDRDSAFTDMMEKSTEVDEEDVVPTYAPLPRRVRRGANKRNEPVTTPIAPACSSMDTVSSSTDATQIAITIQNTSLNGNIIHVEPRQQIGNSSTSSSLPPMPKYGAALGPSWPSVISTRLAETPTVDISLPTVTNIPTPPSTIPVNTKDHSSRLLPPFTLHTQCDIVSIRGTRGTAGAVGILADGAWHSIETEVKVNTVADNVSNATNRPSMVNPTEEGPVHSKRRREVTCNNPVEATDSDHPVNDSVFPLTVRLSTGEEIEVDAILCAIGVQPVLVPFIEGERPHPPTVAHPHVPTVSWDAAHRLFSNDKRVAVDITTNALRSASHAYTESAPLVAFEPVSNTPISNANPSTGRMMGNASLGGYLVNAHMRCSGCADSIYAAGDVTTVIWPQVQDTATTTGKSIPALWHQLRTWTQARSAGRYAAACILHDAFHILKDDGVGSKKHDAATRLLHWATESPVAHPTAGPFLLFTHVTSLLHYRVVLLGLWNGQGLGVEQELAVRQLRGVTIAHDRPVVETTSNNGDTLHVKDVQVQLRLVPHNHYIKIVLLRGIVVGALLVGDTGLEETLENLMLSGTPILGSTSNSDGTNGNMTTRTADVLDLLGDDIDVDDYFD